MRHERALPRVTRTVPTIARTVAIAVRSIALDELKLCVIIFHRVSFLWARAVSLAWPRPPISVPQSIESIGSPEAIASLVFARSNAFSREPGGSSPAFDCFFAGAGAVGAPVFF